MPEGPSIIILKDLVKKFTGRKVLQVAGNTTIEKDRLAGCQVKVFRSWGKHFLICFPRLTLRVHFLLFGSYSIDEQTKPHPRLHLKFANGDLYLYTCSLRILEGSPDDVYDWTADVMSDLWDPAAARRKLRAIPDMLVCDALLDQDIFAGVGNIIKNEVLFRIRVHPESLVGSLPPRKLGELVREARNYSFDFLDWKRQYQLRAHWLAHTKRTCPRCHIPLIKVARLGKKARRAFYCGNCQKLYA